MSLNSSSSPDKNINLIYSSFRNYQNIETASDQIS